MDFLKKNKLAAGILLILLLVWGNWGYERYTDYTCTNVEASNWEQHRLVECSVYYVIPEDERVKPQDETLVPVDPLLHLELLRGVHVPTFEEIDSLYSKDKKSVFYRSKKLKGAHPESFAQIDGEYYADRQSVYWQDDQVAGASPDAFAVFAGDHRYARDGEKEFYAGQEIEVAASSTSAQFLVAPFAGDEVTAGVDREIFWKRDAVDAGDSVAIAVVDEAGGLTWVANEPVDNSGTYTWTPAIINEKATYSLVFYIHRGEAGVLKVAAPTTFQIVDSGSPGVTLSIDFQSEDIVSIEAGHIAYVSWAASNVSSCWLRTGGNIPLIGHSYMEFFNEGVTQASNLLYAVECTTPTGVIVSDEVKIKLEPKVIEVEE